MSKGTLAGLTAYILWGLFPLYWKMLDQVPALEILGHRVVWSFIALLGLLALSRRWGWLQAARRDLTLLRPFVASALLLGVNWYAFIWAVNSDHVVEASLGYFITPLVSVVLGLAVLKERLRPWQWLAVAIAAAGVTYLTWNYGGLPWIAVTLALSFGLYGLIRKMARLGSLEGLSTEMAILFLPALALLLTLGWNGEGAFAGDSLATTALLTLTGIITAGPLLLFAFGAKRVTLTTLGIMQYVAPTLQFILGVYVFGEAFTRARLVGFAVIWVALLIYTADGVRWSQQRARLRRQAGRASA